MLYIYKLPILNYCNIYFNVNDGIIVSLIIVQYYSYKSYTYIKQYKNSY